MVRDGGRNRSFTGVNVLKEVSLFKSVAGGENRVLFSLQSSSLWNGKAERIDMSGACTHTHTHSETDISSSTLSVRCTVYSLSILFVIPDG